MAPFVILIILLSAFTHAAWNLFARRERAEAHFFYRMLVVVALVGLAPCAVSEFITRSLTAKAWFFVGMSGLICGAYYFFLALGYESSDFTLVYPLARALPVLLIGAGDALRGRYPTVTGWAGMVLVVAGCCLAPLTSFRDIRLRSYINRTTVWVLLTALGTVGYTMFDKAAAEIVRQGPATAARYGYVFFFVSLLAYAAILRIFKKATPCPPSVGWKLPALGGLLAFASYWLVLWAYQLSERASYIVAFRQFSIVIGVVIAFAVYREKGKAVRLTATLLITVGLVTIAMWGR